MYADPPRDWARWETYSNWPDEWFGIVKETKHPQDRSQRLYINEKKKKRKQNKRKSYDVGEDNF
jgi:hypothetical protein